MCPIRQSFVPRISPERTRDLKRSKTEPTLPRISAGGSWKRSNSSSIGLPIHSRQRHRPDRHPNPVARWPGCSGPPPLDSQPPTKTSRAQGKRACESRPWRANRQVRKVWVREKRFADGPPNLAPTSHSPDFANLFAGPASIFARDRGSEGCEWSDGGPPLTIHALRQQSGRRAAAPAPGSGSR